MKIYKTEVEIIIENDQKYYVVKGLSLDQLINRSNLYQYLNKYLEQLTPVQIDLNSTIIEAPIQSQEIWASGVTYFLSRSARMEESEDGGDVYDRVYEAERPELFFKALRNRTSGHLGELYIRKDSIWDVPEPELTLFINSDGEIQGYSIGNDMSSRSIEGQNPLYLPQAKVFEKCAGLGPCIYVPEDPINQNTNIKLEIVRDGKVGFADEIKIDQMKRNHNELVAFLYRECEFLYGCFLMTGTGIVPPNEFTLKVGDQVNISIDGIGTLSNIIAKNLK